jgi:hypothetical protein
MRSTALATLVLGLVSLSVSAQQVPLTNWAVPPYRSIGSGGITTMTDITPPRAFIGIQPCRVADTRGNGAPIQGGIFANSQARNWTVWGICGIPTGADAVSVNFSVVSTAATPAGAFLLAWPTGQAPPPTAIMTYGPGATILSNAAIVPLNGSGQMTVNVSNSTHVIMDVNGYFSDTLQNTANSFKLTSDAAFPGATLVAENFASGAGAVAIQGVISSIPAGSSSAAVRGINNNTVNNNGLGVWGSHAGAGWGVLGESQTGFGVVGKTSGSIGIGVFGQTASTTNNNAGVWGVTGGTSALACCDVAGVRGESAGGFGVLGISKGGIAAVFGVRTDASNQILNVGELGTVDYAVFSDGNAYVAGTFAAAVKNFVEPHPLDASKEIRYVSLEGPRSEVYFRGTAQVSQGVTRIAIPDEFRLVAARDTYSTLVTPVGGMATVAVISEGEDGIVIEASRNVKVHYVVYAERESIHQSSAIIDNVHFRGDSEVEIRHFPDSYRQRMIQNGTLNPDGTVNMETARRLGWDKMWEKRGRPAPQPTSD